MLSHPIRLAAIIFFALVIVVIKDHSATAEAFVHDTKSTAAIGVSGSSNGNNGNGKKLSTLPSTLANVITARSIIVESSIADIGSAAVGGGSAAGGGGSAATGGSAASVSTTPPSATGGNETELKEYLHQQRIARRMQYIQQQVKSTLHIRNNPHNVTTPSLTRLPDVLMQKLIHPTTVTPNDEIYPEIPEGEPRRRQVVLLPEEDSVNCVRSGNFNHGDVLCLKFNLPDDLLSAGTTSAVLWVNKNHLAIPADNQSQANFFVYEMIQWNVPLSVDKLYGPQKVIDKDGWYQIEIADMIRGWQKGWQMSKDVKHRTIVIECDICKPSLKKNHIASPNTAFAAGNEENEGNHSSSSEISPPITLSDGGLIKKKEDVDPRNKPTEESYRNNFDNKEDAAAASTIDNCTDSFHVNLNDDKSTRGNNNSRHKQNGAFLLLSTQPEQNARWKRGADCITGQQECCREDLYVNLSELNDQYKTEYYPAKFNAYICKGNCYFHSFTSTDSRYSGILTYFRSRYNGVPSACCTPTKFSSLDVFYASDTSTVEKTLIPNVIVESCGCV